MLKIKHILKFILGAIFVLAGANHFFNSDFYTRIMPAYLPWHLFLVYLSGLFEILLGILLVVPKTTRPAAWGLIALLIAVFPANINMAVSSDQFPEYSFAALLLRLPLQLVLIAWVYVYTSPTAGGPKKAEQ
jgi:uncharacterized membrane protein